MTQHPRGKERNTVETWARRRWMGFVVGVFVAQATLWGVALWLVGSDESHAIVSDYDQRALDWDAHVQARARSAALGWTASVTVDPRASDQEGRVLSVELDDRDGRPISDAVVEASIFHQARATERTTIALEPRGPGGYAGLAPMTRAGKWRVELSARRGGDELLLERTVALEVDE